MPTSASSTSRSVARSRFLMPALRYAWRLPGVLVLLLLGLMLTVLLGNPLTGRRGLLGVRCWQPAVLAWSGAMLRLFGFRIRSQGVALADPVLLVANHVSWLDIQAVHSQRAASFVAKSEIARWPVVGWLARQAGTIFHRRGDPDSLQAVMAVMRERLAAGQSVIVFPEGGTGRGDRVRPFHARILQVALDTGVPIQPVALVYGRDGRMDLTVPFRPGETFLTNALRLLGQAPMEARVHFLPPLVPGEQGRRQLADAARACIAAVVDGVDTADTDTASAAMAAAAPCT
ncbi:MAG: lysophospholipid acyltransferase family protein [Lysobacterales bacterium]